MVKTFIVSDKNSRSSKIKNAILKKIKSHSLAKSNLIVVIGGDGFMLETLKNTIDTKTFLWNKFRKLWFPYE